ncbi:TetR/AcrR family transcriptional regulator [Amycolatopsis sp. WQ 127309]|uniref:TetR/AcrR family transcriptional regulator n=1 Tax=Amycolatopsis sp. WQ 127309 TaxID=2932773 RepID=UPI001FF2650C|nr:TetR/AcrR family transcriptional regulator [Amycolatopsis sp. WQ 127309]UOZ03724.1 TetR/AcrR family transcriptional regulator [Amycolatopsis sp. WQ 127309]
MPPADEADDAQEPRSRRERPAKPALTRQGIIDTALGILRDEGLEKVTMRRVAAALDSGHASLYVYVRNTEDLHAQILDVLLGELRPSVTGPGTWRDRVKGLLSGYGQLLMRYPGIARMALSTQPSGPNYLALVDTVLALLQEGGVPDRAAAWGVDLLLLFPTAVAVEFSAPAAKTEKAAALSALATKITTVDAARYPHIAPLSAALVSGDGGSRGDWAFDVLLDGILAASPPPAPDQDLP